MRNPIVYFVAIILALGAFLLFNNSQTKTTPSSDSQRGEVAENGQADDPQVEKADTNNSPRYVTYSPPSFEEVKDKKRVYFFHATWCETCFAANKEFTEKRDLIPEDVVLFKTDYDSEKELKKQYGITYQHTFVYVDSDGNQVKKWNGGAIDELKTNTK